jgi:hypothetical protein
LLELAKIDITLMEADEQDRKSVSLIGVRGAEVGENTTNNGALPTIASSGNLSPGRNTQV